MEGVQNYCFSEICTWAEHARNIETCGKANNRRCFLFATKEKIIWKDHGNFMATQFENVQEKFGSYFVE